MPIFEYQCTQCSEKFEKIIFGEEKTVKCPNCGTSDTRKLLSGFAIASQSSQSAPESGPCPCSAAERGMCQMGMK